MRKIREFRFILSWPADTIIAQGTNAFILELSKCEQLLQLSEIPQYISDSRKQEIYWENFSLQSVFPNLSAKHFITLKHFHKLNMHINYYNDHTDLLE